MPIFNPTDPLAIPQLYQHTYDIDTLIMALCSPSPQWLDTTNGSLHAEEPTIAPTSHRFVLEPLPASFIGSLGTSPERRLLDEADVLALDALLPTLTIEHMGEKLQQPTRLGGWLRERVKEVALEWLDMHNLIPPSMRHINRRTETLPATGTTKRVRMMGEV